LRLGIDGRELIKEGMTGIGRYLCNFLEFALKARPGHTFILYGNQNTKVDFGSPNLKIEIIPEKNTFFWDHITLSRCISKDSVDIFFSPFDKAPIFSSIPVISTVHDLLFSMVSEKGYRNRYFYNTIYLLLRRAIANKAHLIITVSQHSKEDIIQKWGIPGDKVKVIPNGVSKRFRPVESFELIGNIREKYGIKKDYILYVGNFRPHKNVPTLLEAFAKLPTKLRDNYQLVLTGKLDRYSTRLREMINNLRLDGEVVFIRMVYEEDLPALYSGAMIFVFPSLYEGFGLPPLEAMSCGTPVICSNVSSLIEVVGDSGVLVDPAESKNFVDAMELLLSNRSLRDTFRYKGLQRAKKFSLEHTAKKLLETIENVVTVH
jgi:glycosyltransferase involved in cell wall biosynthesis